MLSVSLNLVPCPKGFNYIAPDKCNMCSVDTTTISQGEALCVDCPDNSKTYGKAGPRRKGPIRCECKSMEYFDCDKTD